MKRWKGDSGGLGLVRELPVVDDETPTHCAEERRGNLADVGQTIGEWVTVGKLYFNSLKTIATTLGTAILDSFLLVFVFLCG